LSRPPDTTVQWFEEFETYMENTSSENDQVVMMGDFNVDQKNIKMIE
jgi:exonuclease III